MQLGSSRGAAKPLRDVALEQFFDELYIYYSVRKKNCEAQIVARFCKPQQSLTALSGLIVVNHLRSLANGNGGHPGER
jgi:hypothetical protein